MARSAVIPTSVRRAAAGDSSGILECLASAFEPCRSRYTPDAYRDTVLTPETLHDRMASMSVLVAVSDAGTIVGTVAHQKIADDEGHLRGMAVLPEWRGTGLAARLLAAAERELGAQGCSRISLDTTEPLRRAVRFYEKHGYRHTGRVRQFSGMPLFEYVKMLRRRSSAVK